MIYIIQPAVPKYRVSFFKGINDKKNITIYSTKKDFLGVKSTATDDYVKYIGRFKKIFGAKAFWHSKLPLWRGYQSNDVVVVNGNPRVLNYMILLALLRLRGIKAIWWGHGWSAGSHGLSASIRLKLMRLLSNYQLVYTEAEKERLQIDTVYALNNGLDSVSINEAIGNVRRSPVANTQVEKTALFFIGRVSEKSNFSLLLEALSKTKGDYTLHVIGSDSQAIIDNYPDIKSKVIWHGEVYDEKEIAHLVLGLGFFVYAGAVGLSLIHAFNYSKPAIVHSCSQDHMPEFASFREDYNGYSFEKGNVESFAGIIEKAINISQSDYAYMSKNARRTIEDAYNIDDMVTRFNKLIEVVYSK